MAVQQVRAKVLAAKGLNVEVKARQFSYIIDEPAELGGTDKGPTPLEALLGALGACQAMVARFYAESYGVQLDDLEIELEGDIDFDGFLQKGDARPGLSDIRYNFIVKSPSPKANVERLFAHAAKVCPVGDSLAAPVSLVLNEVIVQDATDKVVA